MNIEKMEVFSMPWWHRLTLWEEFQRRASRNKNFMGFVCLVIVLTALGVLFVMLICEQVVKTILGKPNDTPSHPGLYLSISVFLSIGLPLLVFGFNYISYPFRLWWHPQRRAIGRLLRKREELKRARRRRKLPGDEALSQRIEKVGDLIVELYRLPAEQAKALRKHQEEEERTLVWEPRKKVVIQAADEAVQDIREGIETTQKAEREARTGEMGLLTEALNEVEGWVENS